VMNKDGFTTAPEWVQATMIIGEMLRAFAGRGTATLVSMTEEQSDAVRFADAFMEGRATRFAEVLMDRLLRPLDEMSYCDSRECKHGGYAPSCHVHKPAVAAAIIRRWVEVGSPKARAINGAEVLDDAWKVLCDLSRTTDHEGAKSKIDELAEAAFNKAREIVKTEIDETDGKGLAAERARKDG
jgi:hypothetical protein